MKLYGLKTCDTCRKALRALTKAGHEVTFVDVRADGVDNETLSRFLDAFDTALINTRSTTWRGLSEDERTRPAMDLLRDHPTLMKRPVIEGETLTLGWSADVQRRYL